jgi:hypothetical protein
VKSKFFLLLIMLVSSSAVWSDQNMRLKALVEGGQLTVNAWLQPEADAVVSQQVLLNIEVATTTWFAGGTKIGLFDIDDVVVLRREKFANNSTKRETGQTWVVQVWTIALYPQRAARFTVPEIELTLAIADGNGGEIEGTAKTSPISFSAVIPRPLAEQKQWVATSSLRVEQSVSRDIETLRVGDAIVRTIEIKADDIAAMMLPTLTAKEYDGLAVYEKLPKVEDSVNRGSYFAARTQELTYVAEKQGQYIIPEQEFYWWDTTNNSVQVEELPKLTVTVGAGAPVEESAVDDESVSVVDLLQNNKDRIVQVLALVILFVIALILALKLIQLVKRCKPLPRVNLEKQFKRACKDADVVAATNLMYQWLEQGGDEIVVIREFKQYKNDETFKCLFDELMSDSTPVTNVSMQDFAVRLVALHKSMKSQAGSQQKSRLRLN